MICEYFTRYGNGGVPGVCTNDAKLELTDGERRRTKDGGSPICVCFMHATRIVARYPELGDIDKRFEAL